MTLKKIFALTIAITAILSAVLVVSYINLISSEKKLKDAITYEKDAILLSNTMTQSSENLTNDIRLYAMTGTTAYRDSYFKTLDISNGKTARPDGTTLSFKDMVKGMNLTREENANILKSNDFSMNLVTLETEVMNFVDQWLKDHPGEDLSAADDLDLAHQQIRLFNREYMNEIDKIMQPVAEFQKLLMGRVALQIKDASAIAESTKLFFIVSMSLLVFIIILILIYLSFYISKNIKLVVDIFGKLAEGDLSEKLNTKSKDEFGVLSISVNAVIAIIGSLIMEAEMLTKAAVEGRLSTRGDAAKFKGGYHTIVEGVNKTLDAVIGPLNVAANYVDRISKGDVPPKITDTYNGDFNELKNNLNLAIDNLNSLVSDAVMLVQAAVDGKLATRADASKHQGDYRKIVDGVNKTLDLVVTPINETIEIMKKLADGDLTSTMDNAYKGDFDVLKTAMNASLVSIGDTLGQINNAVEQVAEGSLQVSQASQSLSQGATEQASSLEEITSSVTEIASQTKQNTVNASQMTDLAKTAKKNAEMGNMQMKDLVAAMADINKSADEIKKIVKAIDDISFQINLLALNANVEAARAGKYGKGFAVVAEEVRNLAVRSANSVKETTRMVDETITNINRGNTLVEGTAKQLNEIVSGAGQVAALSEQVATAGKEQAQGLEQVSLGLNQIDQVTQANTASAEESASASEELSAQSQEVKNMLSRFKLRARESKMNNAEMMQMLKVELAKQQGIHKNPTVVNRATGIVPVAGKKAQRVNPADVISLDDDNFGKF